jgi:hypothetical protein
MSTHQGRGGLQVASLFVVWFISALFVDLEPRASALCGIIPSSAVARGLN